MRRPPQSLLKRFWRNSQTKAWAYTQLAASGVMTSIAGINSYVSSPEFKDYLNTVDAPKTLIAAVATLGLLTYIFHGHGDD